MNRPSTSTNPSHKRGFALVVTISLMILLTVIAVGLLTLSSISLRNASQADAMSAARANARLALMLALGDLQKNAGPDQRVTARADVDPLNAANPRLTGVWNSMPTTPLPVVNDYSKTSRDAKFVGWLASSLDGKASNQVTYAKTAVASPVTLWGKGTLGSSATTSDLVSATKVPIPRGGYAYAVMDEGVKVRINTPYVDAAATADVKTAQLGSGASPNASLITGLDKLDRSFFEKTSIQYPTIAKGISNSNLALAAESLASGTRANLKPLGHDVTTTSVGLFTDTASGGLKEDINLLANSGTLPASYSGKGVYASRLAGFTDVSDPRWESLHQIARIYKDNDASTGRLINSGGVPVLQAQGAPNWQAATDSAITTGTPAVPVRDVKRTPPPGIVLMPTIAKVQVVFSLMTRDIYKYPVNTAPPTNVPMLASSHLHGPWDSNFAGSSYQYLLHLLYTPVVTLRNPYNVALEFSQLRIVFGNVPFAVQVFRNDVAMTKNLAPLDELYYQAAETGNINKRFAMTLKTNGGTPTVPAVGSPTFRMLPGEVMMFSPFINPNLTWQNEESNTRFFSDWDNSNSRTQTLDALPGWQGDGIGFDLDWFCPSAAGRVSGSEVEPGKLPTLASGARGGCIGARAQDQFYVQFAPLSVPGLCLNKFDIEMFAAPAGTANQTTPPSVSSQIIEMDYESPTGLQDTLIGAGGTLRCPKTGSWNTMEMFSHSSVPIKSILTAKPFVVVSAQAKATKGGYDVNAEDGKLATKPWCFAHADIGSSSQKVVTEGAANHSHEVSVQRLENGTAQLFQYDFNSGRGNSITGQTGNSGIKFGAQYDIPLGPIQSLASLNSANPGGSSGYLPRFAQPIGNSWAHPLLDPNRYSTSGSYTYLDHSFLLNLALYDHFYCSGLGDQTGAFGSGRTTSALATDFMAGIPLTDPRLTPFTPNGKNATALTTDLNSATPHTLIASWQMMNGAFNINSTSVAAWKAMLGSVHDSQAIINLLDKTNKTSSFVKLSATVASKRESRISRFRLPVSESSAHGGAATSITDAYWMGPREYKETELQTLAQNIVAQIQLRGPALSLADFVNRRLGPVADNKAQRGALQQAIDDSNLNQGLATNANAGFEIPAATVANYKYQNVPAGTGSSYQGAPGYLSQADIMAVLGNAATARSDTFTIRGYGEAKDASGKVIAATTCEAVVQRIPNYVDPADKAETATAALTSSANKNFGRRFQIVSFRWLGQNEI